MNAFSKFCVTASILGYVHLPNLVCGQTYDALPLRGALSDKPHFQTADGREEHRFASAEINRYRLYDFYAR